VSSGGGEWGHTLTPDEMSGEIAHALAEADRPGHGDQSASEWLKENLFATWYHSIFTIVFSLVSLYLGYRTAMFVFVNGEWEPVRTNLELFMIGRFPREERDRIVANVIMFSGAAGLGIGWIRARANDRARLAGVGLERSSPRELFSSYWAIGAFVLALMLIGVRTVGPWLLVAACIASGVAGFQLAARAPLALRAASLTASLLVGTIAFQILSGTGGLAWVYLTLALAPLMFDLIARSSDARPSVVGWVGVALAAGAAVFFAVDRGVGAVFVLALALTAIAAFSARRDGAAATRIGALVVAGFATWQVGKWIGISNIDWDEWGGLYMNLVAASVSIVIAFPFGLLLALGRRSKLPALRLLSTVYIEFIRGVPLITLLLMATFFLGFFIDTDTPLSLPTRAFAAITLFSAAYIAEIVRGGLQSVPQGQVEAGQSLGMSPGVITQLLVLPQALRAVIPAMVGQFISLFKDTSLLVIIGVLEFLGVREVVHSQREFQSVGIAETLVFVAFGFWAISFTMSRESQRLERRLGVGER
jgi:general L-amino acid transport system permease protein